MEAFISRITAEGPSANLPPHIALELSLRSAIALLLTGCLLIGGCDRQSGPVGQANESAPAATAEATPAANTAGGSEKVVEEVIGTIDRSHKGETAPTALFDNPAGSKVNISSFAGKPVLLNLWATWCAPCVKEMPTLDALAVTLGDSVTVLAVSQDSKGPEAVDPFFQKAGFKKLQPYIDRKMDLSLGLGVNLPTTILYDSQGREVWRMLGSMDWTGETAKELIAEAK
jgi:thiol-disulfide isomerase/thioredoxin